MSKLQELINELCPDGVGCKTLKDVANISIGEFVHKNLQSDSYSYPVYNGGVTNTGFYNKHNQEKNKIIISARGANAGFVNRVFEDFWAGNSCYVISTDETFLNWHYAYYYIKNKEEELKGTQQTGSIPSVSKKQIEEMLIDIPPLPVQEEIVKILDKMTDYVTELKAELKARKMQYEYYRDDLLAFGNNAYKGNLQDLIKELCPDGVEHKPLKDVTILNGLKQVSAEKLFSLNTFSGEIKLLPSSSNYDWCCEETKELNEYLYEDEVITLGRARNANIKYHNGKFIASQNHIVRSKNKRELNTKYLYYFLSSNAQSFYTTQSNYPLFNKNDFNNCKIPVPPLPVQEEIARILDKFNSICNDISTGLPAEIEARQKQYEYYRDKLLSFQKLENEEC